ncbi:MAG: SMP-30/gluconolactonase/LRE family protein [Litoreibacter sp.]
MIAKIHDSRICALGEGPLWHPELKKLFWFDILGCTLLCDDGRTWHFDEHVSAAGWIDINALLIASETGLFRYNIETKQLEMITPLEAELAHTRSNDGRADPWGGFWIGTMGKNAEDGAGAIYRYYQGKLTKLFAGLTITNSICFSPDGTFAYYTDTTKAVIMRTPLDSQGFPKNDGDIFIDLAREGVNPDGSVIASDGTLLNAQWGAARVARYGRDGNFIAAYGFPASQITCPAFAGARLFATSAAQGVDELHAGKTFAIETTLTGQREHQVIL